MNVDYFDPKLENPTSKLSASRQELPRERQDKHQDKRAPGFVPLELERTILSAISESRREGIRVSELIELLEERHKVNFQPIGPIDCAISNLTASGRLLLQPMTRAQLEESPGRPQANKQAASSAFVGHLMTLSPEEHSASSIGSEQSYYGEPAKTDLGEAHKVRRISAVSSSTSKSSNSKSTTLDSGFQLTYCESERENSAKMFDLEPEQHATSARDKSRTMDARQPRAPERTTRGFPFNRSLSFVRSTRTSNADTSTSVDRWNKDDLNRIELAAKDREDMKSENPREIRKQKNLSGLSSLFRSKSMRIISSGDGGRRTGELAPPQQTIDNRSTTTRWLESSFPGQETLNQCDGAHQSGATIDYLSTAQQHKRSFSMRRSSILAFKSSNHLSSSEIKTSSKKIVLFLRKLFNLKRSKQNGLERKQETNDQSEVVGAQSANIPSNFGYKSYTMTAAERILFNYNRHSKQESKGTIPASPSSSASSRESGSSSLIEILNCSSAVDESRRRLRKEDANPAKSSNRATAWRLNAEPVNSALSHNSLASSTSTIYSTVSQQLRKHLDEAYKRHRNCTNQREKEFIDSINVLRQASRHALQNTPQTTRSSSSNRSRKSNGSKLNDDTASSVVSSSSACHCKQNDYANSTGEDYRLKDSQKQSDLISAKQNLDNNDGEKVYINNSEVAATTTGSHEPNHWSANENHGFLNTCCICSSYITSSAAAAHLCPMAAPSCCPIGNCCQLNDRQLDLPSSPQMIAANDYCCPLWRSMVYNYCQPASFLPSSLAAIYPFSQQQMVNNNEVMVGETTKTITNSNSNLAAEAQQQQLSQRLENYSSSHQQHQHNTTIDLKIEIGADFKKQFLEAGSRRRRPTERRPAQPVDDSLESSEFDQTTTTDDSLNEAEKSVDTDECEISAAGSNVANNQVTSPLVR